MRRHLALVLAAWPSIAAAGAAGPNDDPASYRVHIAVTPAAGATVQRLAIPAEVLAASQSGDLADLRLFDARRRAMPTARVAVAAAALHRDVLKALPILGAADALNVTGVSLRFDQRGQARVARIDGTVAARSTDTAVLGALLDARAIAGAGSSLALDATVPAAQPVTFTVEASSDLKN